MTKGGLIEASFSQQRTGDQVKVSSEPKEQNIIEGEKSFQIYTRARGPYYFVINETN